MTRHIDIDAFVVGAGVGGIYSTYRLSRMGLSVKCIDMASDVGGTWYWNRYPGAMSDTESYLYRYSWDKDDLRTYPWTHHYVYQPEILKYLQHIVAKHDLRKYMQFETEMTSATWNEDTGRWDVACCSGSGDVIVHARYLVNSLGLLSKVNYPNIPGLSSFAGDLVHTARWPEELKLEGKKVGIIGNGSTGTQVMTAIAPIVGSLTSFQRSPQYSVPSGQRPVAKEYRDRVNTTYDQIWDSVWSSTIGFGVPESKRKTMEATPEERQQAFQEVWDQGNGFRFMFSAFGDLTTDKQANEEACKFIRGKIDEMVKDPRKAAILKPKDLYARRPLCDTGYYEIFNRENVDVVDLQATPIEKIVPEGIQTADGTTHQLDALIVATGFDAIQGSYMRLKITGRRGRTIEEHWAKGPKAFGSIACAGFPNMFIVAGPQGPFANFPPVIESEINFIMACIEYAERTTTAGPRIMEVSNKAETEWIDLCNRLVEGSLFTSTASWIFGQNIPGRKPSTNFYFGGLKSYLDWVKDQISNGFPAFISE
ncbi:FAD/NAD(P)-binding domain-containing protein [Aspergillus campestris IBT 28561]|uniref:FAD/NAD(P)-binding domain-containing protein n=1 Tax=Aspergillus campestris (strain IBT 28561) TaxID=1392248 RepID=A0A2I1CXZ0_ASPC2|nr:FAD/NAD(P)-binding domain-containing protein [Aspergillus campestris IBT 28561]PKY02462.1 FAD/NAD(P)-binding domain-containing protein [Aspergillus campestris IBT 28561]